MGNLISTPYEQEFRPLIPYLMETPGIGNVNLNTPTCIKQSNIVNAGDGLFAEEAIPKNTFFIRAGTYKSMKTNDSMIDLTDIRLAQTSEKLYQALKNTSSNYYVLERAQEKVNVIIAIYNGENYFKTIKNVKKDEELVRMYGFSTWLLEIFPLLTWDNLSGYQRFVEEYHQYTGGKDPLDFKMVAILETCAKLKLADRRIPLNFEKAYLS